MKRVEKLDVDKDGRADLVSAAVDRGAEDPGMNYKDKRPTKSGSRGWIRLRSDCRKRPWPRQYRFISRSSG